MKNINMNVAAKLTYLCNTLWTSNSFARSDTVCFGWFGSLLPINNISVLKGPVFLGWTSTKLGLMFLLKDTIQWRRWGSNPRPFCLESSTLPLSHWLHYCCDWQRATPDKIKYNSYILVIYNKNVNVSNKFNFWSVHGIMNTSGILQS